MWTSVYKEGEINPPWRRWCFYWVSQILFILSNLTFPLSVGQFILYLWFGSRRRFRQSTSRKPPKNNSTLPQYSCAVSSPTSSTGYGQNDCSCNQQQFTFWMVPLSPSLHIKIFFKWLNFFSLFILFLVAWRWFKLMWHVTCLKLEARTPLKLEPGGDRLTGGPSGQMHYLVCACCPSVEAGTTLNPSPVLPAQRFLSCHLHLCGTNQMRERKAYFWKFHPCLFIYNRNSDTLW